MEECCLVDQDFLLQAAYERVTYIIGRYGASMAQIKQEINLGSICL